jgi:hypothetical protein
MAEVRGYPPGNRRAEKTGSDTEFENEELKFEIQQRADK